MGYQLLADAVMLVHFAFLMYVALGGFLAWRHGWLIAPHAAAVLWGAVTATVGVPCPLTAWEDAARRSTGEQGLSRGFVDTYLTGVIYPADHLVTAQLLVAALVVASWVAFALRRHLSRRPAAISDQFGSRSEPRSAHSRSARSAASVRSRAISRARAAVSRSG
jgi:hypothetical protein